MKALCCSTSNEYPQHMFYSEIQKIIPKLSSNTPPEQVLCTLPYLA